MSDQRNLILAIVLSVAIIVGFQYFYDIPRTERERARQQEISQEAPGPTQAPPRTGVLPAPAADVQIPSAAIIDQPAQSTVPTRESIMDASPRIKLLSHRVRGSFRLRGGRIDDLTLVDYRETPDPDSDQITLLSPSGASHPYFAQFGWVVSDREIAVPGSETVWQASRNELAPGRPATVTWDNGEGLHFTQVIAVDNNYMFTVTQRVRNTGTKPVTLYPYGLVSRTGTPEILGFFILHEGLLGVFNGTLEEIDYDDLQDEETGKFDEQCSKFSPNLVQPPPKQEQGTIENCSKGGWIGITDKYWLTALIPDQKSEVRTRFKHFLGNDKDIYQVDYRGAWQTVAPGRSVEVTGRLFAGAKEVKLLDAFTKDPGIQLFDRAVDWGWFWFITKPIFYALDFFNERLGNFGLAILLLTVLIKAAFFPLANKSYRAMSKMKKLQPEMVKLRERFKDDRTRMNQEIMALYKREKANPASGCMPMVIQIPVFFALYKVLFVTIEMRHAPFYGWITDLSARDPTSVFNLFGLLPFAPSDFLPDFLALGAWPLIMGASMFLQMKLNPQPADPVQAKIFLFMPIVFTFILAPFPAGLVIYWAWNNMLSMAQQWVIMKRAGAYS